MTPLRPEREVALWYQYYFQLERGRTGLAANRREIARILWAQWSPNWPFDDACFERTAMAHDNPDYVDVVIHSYRHRFGLADGDPHMPKSSKGWRRCLPSPCQRLHWTAQAMALRRQPMAPPARRNSPAAAFIAWCRAPGTICRRKRPRRLRRR
jgi:hypothetical protein